MTDAPVQVSFAALYQRINRRLGKEDCILRKGKGRYDKITNGDWYVLDREHNTVPRQHVNVVALARELGVLRTWETVGEEETCHKNDNSRSGPAALVPGEHD